MSPALQSNVVSQLVTQNSGRAWERVFAFVHERPVPAQDIIGWLMALPDVANSGDIYATF